MTRRPFLFVAVWVAVFVLVLVGPALWRGAW